MGISTRWFLMPSLCCLIVVIEPGALERLHDVGPDCCQLGKAGESVRARVHIAGSVKLSDLLWPPSLIFRL